MISKLLGVEFDSIWQRHRRLLKQKIASWTLGILALIAALVWIWVGNQPFDVTVALDDISVQNNLLPPREDAFVSLFLPNEMKCDTLHTGASNVVFTNLPHRYLNRPVRMSFSCHAFLDVDTTLVLTKNVKLNIQRNPSVYGDIHFRLWNPKTESFVPGVTLNISDYSVTSDAEGRVSLFIPLESQQPSFPVSASVTLADSVIVLPSGPDDILIVQ